MRREGEDFPPIILIGKSGSGKDTTANYLVSNYPFNRAIEYTTREMRPGERPDVEYHFIDEGTFDSFRINKLLITHQMFERYQNGIKCKVHYGIKWSDISDNSLIVTNPHNMLDIKKQIPEAIVVYINVPFIFREVRLLNRGDSELEINRRAKTDDVDFNNEDVKKAIDICVYNTNSLKTPSELGDSILKRITEFQTRRYEREMVHAY